MILLLDNFDSFTYNLWDYIKRLGVDCKVFRNDTSLETLKKYSFKGIILSPGFGRPEKAGNMMEVIEYYHQKVPILGICLGHQALGEYFGASLEYAQKPMHGKISQIQILQNNLETDIIFQNIPSMVEVVRYHSLLLNLENSLKCKVKSVPLFATAYTSEKELMAFSHTSLPIKGIQFHPEAALTQYGLKMLKNWLILL